MKCIYFLLILFADTVGRVEIFEPILVGDVILLCIQLWWLIWPNWIRLKVIAVMCLYIKILLCWGTMVNSSC